LGDTPNRVTQRGGGLRCMDRVRLGHALGEEEGSNMRAHSGSESKRERGVAQLALLGWLLAGARGEVSGPRRKGGSGPVVCWARWRAGPRGRE